MSKHETDEDRKVLPQPVAITLSEAKLVAGGSPTLPLPPPDVTRLALVVRFEPDPVPW
jgi:hypothetical protein